MALALYLTPFGALDTALEVVRRAEVLGYDSVWVPHGVGRDALLLLGLYGAATTRIGLGSGIIPIYPRHPVALAQEALTLSEATGGRFRLGIGISHRPLMDSAFGIAVRQPLATVREYVGVLRGLFDGRPFEREGRRYEGRGLLQLPTTPIPPPIYLGALAVKMTELAGELADGVVFWLCPPDYIERVGMPALERGRQRAGKTLEGFDVVASVPVALTDARDEAGAVFRQELVRYLGLPYYRAMFEASGYGADVAQFDRTGVVSEHVAQALGRVGNAADLAAWVRRYRKAGVTLPAIRLIGWPQASWWRATVEAAPAW
jgi:alkanesulfonate monooxygenase SsuD/methylene tetrahydromethanopterin reductase-like flavin-dependent oxidoreductase (luciferase family)